MPYGYYGRRWTYRPRFRSYRRSYRSFKKPVWKPMYKSKRKSYVAKTGRPSNALKYAIGTAAGARGSAQAGLMKQLVLALSANALTSNNKKQK